LKSGPPVRSFKATFEIRRRSYTTVPASNSSSGLVFDEYRICRPESRALSRIPPTDQRDINTFAPCSTSPIVHCPSEIGVEDTQRPWASPRSSEDIDGKDCNISGCIVGPPGDCTRKPKVILNEISKTGSVSDEADSGTKDETRSREAIQNPGSPCKSDLIPEHEAPDNTRIDKPADEVTPALQRFEEIFDGCDAEKRFNSDPKKCLLNTKKGQRCGGRIPGKHKDMIREVLASLARLYFKDDAQECIHQVIRLADLAICKRSHRGKARILIDNLLHGHGASIVESVMDGTGSLEAGASRWGGSSTAETTDKSSRTSFKKQEVIPDDIRKEIQSNAKGGQDDGRMRYDFRTTRSTTLKKRMSYLPKFLPYSTREATKSSTTDWLKKQISKPLLPSDLASGWLYVYWNRASFGVVKIGYTTKGVDQRLKGWISKCKHEAELHYRSEQKIPHARRLEQILHAEFASSRYCEVSCGCHGRHKEWFQLPHDLNFQEAIERRTQWMLTEPYEEIQGVWQLKSHHARNLNELGNIMQVPETQEVSKQLKTAVVAKQKKIRTQAPSRGKDGRFRAKRIKENE